MTLAQACLLVLLVLIYQIGHDQVVSLDNGLALTPPMGWMHWERFRCITNCTEQPNDCLTEDLIKSQADKMVSEGYRDAGYQYLSIDDCWMAKERDSQGALVPDPIRFPSGMKALADYIHGKGLKLGIYEDFGTATCQEYPGSEFYLQKDAQTFADWGVDLLKLDGCNSNVNDMKTGYEAMGQFLNKTGRPILYLCSWPAYVQKMPALTDYPAFKKTCNQWRNYDDIQDSWDSLYSIIDYYGSNQYNLSAYAGPGSWNDPDELIVGGFGLSSGQEVVQMGMWAMMASPLFMSLDLRNVRPESKALLLNKNLLAINQDPLGKQAIRVWKINKAEVWIKPLSKPGASAFAIINTDDEGDPRVFHLSPAELGLPQTAQYNMTDVLTNEHFGPFLYSQSIKFTINPTSIFIAIADPS